MLSKIMGDDICLITMVTGTRGKVTLVESHPPSKIAMLTVTCQLSPPKKGTPMFTVIKLPILYTFYLIFVVVSKN